MEENLKIWNDAKRIVVKVGSSLVTNEGHGVDTEAIARWTAQIAKLQEMGKQVVWVSSGAVAEGMARLGWTKRPKKMHELQAAAAVGQMGIVEAYEKSFERYDIRTAQILLTHADLADRERYLNARQTLTTLLDLKVVPIINENDTVVTNEIKVGDNDTLGAPGHELNRCRRLSDLDRSDRSLHRRSPVQPGSEISRSRRSRRSDL